MAVVQFPIQRATEEVPAGPLPVLGGALEQDAEDVLKGLRPRHYGLTHHIGAEGPTFTVETYLPNDDESWAWGKGYRRYIITPQSGVMTKHPDSVMPITTLLYRGLQDCMDKTSFSTEETQRAVSGIRESGLLKDSVNKPLTSKQLRLAAIFASFGRGIDVLGKTKTIPPDSHTSIE
jgi:hypothetical protein